MSYEDLGSTSTVAGTVVEFCKLYSLEKEERNFRLHTIASFNKIQYIYLLLLKSYQAILDKCYCEM